jgi:hypothetical protein
MQPAAGQTGGNQYMDVKFFPPSGCVHSQGGETKGQLRGFLRAATQLGAGGMVTPSLGHALASAARPLEEQLGGNVSSCGANSQVRDHHH